MTATPAEPTPEVTLRCEMDRECKDAPTMLEDKGWVYCTRHGMMRRGYSHRVRKLRPHELNRLKKGQQIERY